MRSGAIEAEERPPKTATAGADGHNEEPAGKLVVIGQGYVGLTLVSEDILFDSIAALGLMIAFYYGITGFACAIYYRRELFRSAKTFLLIGVGPTLGGLMLLGIFVKSCYDLSKPENSESGDSWFGLGPPLVIGVGFLLLGVLLMILWSFQHPGFFRRRPEGADPALLEGRA